MMPMPSRGELADHGVDLGLGADVDAARRLVEDEQRGLGVEPLAQHHLLLVAAGELGDRQVDRGRADRQPLAAGSRPSRVLLAAADEPEAVQVALAATAARCWPRSTSAATGRAGAGPRRHRRCRCAIASSRRAHGDAPRRSSVIDPAVAGAMPKSARPTSVRPAPISPAKPSTSPRCTSKLTSSKTPSRREAAHRQEHVALRRRRARLEEARSRGRPCRRWRAAASTSARGRVEISRPSRNTVTRSAISKTSSMRWLTKRMATPWSRRSRTSLKSWRDLVGRERGGRLVHDQDADVERDRLGDLDRLLRGERQPARRAPDVEGHAELGEDRARPRGTSAASRSTAPRPWWLMKMFSATLRSGKSIGSW